MDVRFITLRIFKFQEKEKTRLKSGFGLFLRLIFFDMQHRLSANGEMREQL